MFKWLQNLSCKYLGHEVELTKSEWGGNAEYRKWREAIGEPDDLWRMALFSRRCEFTCKDCDEVFVFIRFAFNPNAGALTYFFDKEY